MIGILNRAIFRLAVLAAFATALATRAFALDGQIEIFQTSSTQFPIRLRTSGSYVLKSNLLPPLNSDAIDIESDNVTLDLNGFSIIGPGSGQSFSTGIKGFPHSNIRISNGTVTTMGGFAVYLGSDAEVEGVNAIGNQSDGIEVGDRSEVTDCDVSKNLGRAGVGCGSGCLIHDNTVNGNSGDGVKTFNSLGGVVIRNSASGNSGLGLQLFTGAGYGENVMENNGTGCAVNGTSTGDNICNGVKQ